MSLLTINATVKSNVKSNPQTNWNDLQVSTTAGSIEQTPVVCKCEATSWREVNRGITTFDTSSVPDDATISNVIFRGVGNFKLSGFGGNLYLRALATASNTTVTSSDYNKANFTTSLGEKSWGDLTASGNNDVTILASHINKIGYTKIGLIHSNDFNGNDPGNNAGNSLISFSDVSLLVTYTVPATLTTGPAINLQPTSATVGGEILTDGGGTITERGVCWSTTVNPTTTNSKAAHADDTIGVFNVQATNLLPGVLYYYRTYVITENSTQYGSSMSFRTPGGSILFNFL